MFISSRFLSGFLTYLVNRLGDLLFKSECTKGLIILMLLVSSSRSPLHTLQNKNIIETVPVLVIK